MPNYTPPDAKPRSYTLAYVTLGLILGASLAPATTYYRENHTERLIVANGCGQFDPTSGEFTWKQFDDPIQTTTRILGDMLGGEKKTHLTGGKPDSKSSSLTQ